MISRREVFLGGCGALLARLAAAQPQLITPRLAILEQGEPVENMVIGANPWWNAFLVELRNFGHIEGESIVIDRWSASSQDAAELLKLADRVLEAQPDLLFLRGTQPVIAFKEATAVRPIPIVAVASFTEGLVASFARPGGNITGFDVAAGVDLYVKHLELLQDAVPGAKRVAWLGTTSTWEGSIGEAVRSSASQLGLVIVPFPLPGSADESSVRAAFDGINGADVHALLIAPSVTLTQRRDLVAELAIKVGLPSIGLQGVYATAGALMTYGPSWPDLFRRAAGYVDLILWGADPAVMPIQQPTEYDFIVNLRTAESLTLIIPPEIMLFATEIIE